MRCTDSSLAKVRWSNEKHSVNQFETNDDPMDETETVFKYIKVVLNDINSSWEELLHENRTLQPDFQPGVFPLIYHSIHSILLSFVILTMSHVGPNFDPSNYWAYFGNGSRMRSSLKNVYMLERSQQGRS